MSFFYRAYGLSILSDMPVPGLKPQNAATNDADVILEMGAEPEWVRGAFQLPSYCFHKQAAEPETGDPAFVVTALGGAAYFELAYTDGTRFVVDGHGTRMWGNWAPPLTKEDLATYLLGPAMGFLLRRRGVTSLHASAVCIGQQAIALNGEAQAGKSTTAAALALRGVPVLCEDVTALREEDTFFFAESGYPRICLWPDSVKHLMGASDALPRLTPNWEKCFFELDGVRANFEPQSRRVGAVYLFAPRSNETDAPRVEEISRREALLEMVQNTYMNWLLDRTQRAVEFDVLARMVDRVPVRRVVPHSDPVRIGALCDLLLADAEKLLAEKMIARDTSGR